MRGDAEDHQAVAPSDAVYHLFREVNDHLRATEQKHLQVSVGFISVTVLALSFLVPRAAPPANWTQPLTTWPAAFAYLVVVLAGCATMFAQHVYRGWKKEYLLASKKLVYSWPIGDSDRISWMRTDRGPYEHSDRGFFRLAGDNVLFWFVMIITSCVALMLVFSLTKLVVGWWIWLTILPASLAYLVVLSYITAGGVKRKGMLEDDWQEFCSRNKRVH
jgi:hypothetical protein